MNLLSKDLHLSDGQSLCFRNEEQILILLNIVICYPDPADILGFFSSLRIQLLANHSGLCLVVSNLLCLCLSTPNL